MNNAVYWISLNHLKK